MAETRPRIVRFR